jgi:hypothetical protein
MRLPKTRLESVDAVDGASEGDLDPAKACSERGLSYDATEKDGDEGEKHLADAGAWPSRALPADRGGYADPGAETNPEVLTLLSHSEAASEGETRRRPAPAASSGSVLTAARCGSGMCDPAARDPADPRQPDRKRCTNEEERCGCVVAGCC